MGNHVIHSLSYDFAVKQNKEKEVNMVICQKPNIKSFQCF